MYSREKRGQYFEIDALIAISILIVGLIYIKNLDTNNQNSEDQYESYSQEAIKLFRNVKVNELEPYYLIELEYGGGRQHMESNFTIAQQVGNYMLWGQKQQAANISREILEDLIPLSYGYSVWVSNSTDRTEVISSRTFEEGNSLAVSRTLVSGLYKSTAGTRNISLREPVVLEIEVWR